MAEVMDVAPTDDPTSSTLSIDILDDLLSDRHLPNFKFDQYPLLNLEDPLGSPRIRDEEWSSYEN